jgi:LAO/AO transport system kinase
MTAGAAPTSISSLLAQFDEGKKAALARAVSIVENRRTGADELLAALHPRLGTARRIGITGPPGAGKSTLTTELAAAYRAAGLTVGIVAVDPTSPFTGGALLGDRIRMEAIALDPGIFIRSMATRGSLGGLASSTRDVSDVLDAYGLDRVIIETVGVGQTELDVSRVADTTVVVLVPESGDSIQTLKAGLMEIADIFVVNKSDRPGSDRLRNELELMLGMRGGSSLKNIPAHHGIDLTNLHHERSAALDHERSEGSVVGRTLTKAEKLAMNVERKRDEEVAATEGRRYVNPARAAREAAKSNSAESWTPPVLRTVGVKKEGIDEMVSALDRHAHYLMEGGLLAERRRKRLKERVVEIVERTVHNRLWSDASTAQWLDGRIPALESGSTNPFAVAHELVARSGDVMIGRPK